MSHSRTQILGLYRQILFAAKRFPSIKKHSIIKEIRTAFREDSTLTNAKAIEDSIDVALKGLQQLSMYVNLPKNSSSWVINLEKNPMPKQNNIEEKVPLLDTLGELEDDIKSLSRK